MVLGTILYESIDLTYHILKLGYYGVTGVYNWISGTEKKEMTKDDMQCVIQELQQKIEQLEEEQKNMETNEAIKSFTKEEIEEIRRELSKRH